MLAAGVGGQTECACLVYNGILEIAAGKGTKGKKGGCKCSGGRCIHRPFTGSLEGKTERDVDTLMYSCSSCAGPYPSKFFSFLRFESTEQRVQH